MNLDATIFMILAFLGMGLLAINAHISENGDIKNTISAIKNRISKPQNQPPKNRP